LGRGESRFAIRRGEVVDPVLPEDGREAEDEEFQPMPDSRSIEDLIGTGEFESKRSLKGDLRVAMNVNSDQG